MASVMNLERKRCWLAAYTSSRHEGQYVADRLVSKGWSQLPTYERFSYRWSDRVQRSHAPLFPGYLTNNPRFLWDIALQFSGLKRFEARFDH